MAKQRGILKLDGTIADITFLKTRDGYLAKEKGGVSASRIASDPAFQRTRENGSEFGRAGKGSRLLRKAFRSQLLNTKDKRMGSRLQKELMVVVKSDLVNGRGLRTVSAGNLSLLEGFEFNDNAPFTTSFSAGFTTSIDRATGDMTVSIPSFSPLSKVAIPLGASHFKITSAAGEIDFDNEVYIVDSKESAYLPWNANATAAINLVNSVTANSTHPLFLLLGIEFSQEVNGNYYSLNNGAFKAMSIVKVDA